MLEKAAENMSFSSQNSLVLRVIGKPIQIQQLSTMPPDQANLSESSGDSDQTSEDECADETLRAATPSVVFDDEEAWESCSQSSLSNVSDNNPLASSVEELGHPLVTSTPPVKEKIVNNSEPDSNVPLLGTTKHITPTSANIVIKGIHVVCEYRDFLWGLFAPLLPPSIMKLNLQ